MPPAARTTDERTRPMVTGVVPDVGGPILPPGAPAILIDFLLAATITAMATGVGLPDMIMMESPSPGAGGSGGVVTGLAANGVTQLQETPSPYSAAGSGGIVTYTRMGCE
jgi:hypothetical protein